MLDRLSSIVMTWFNGLGVVSFMAAPFLDCLRLAGPPAPAHLGERFCTSSPNARSRITAEQNFAASQGGINTDRLSRRRTKRNPADSGVICSMNEMDIEFDTERSSQAGATSLTRRRADRLILTPVSGARSAANVIKSPLYGLPIDFDKALNLRWPGILW
jgi:hypothetical protein